MNLINAVVTQVLSKPYFKYNYWFVDVEYNGYGVISKTKIMCLSEEAAKAIEVDYIFQV